jgi:hypothetical protein
MWGSVSAHAGGLAFDAAGNLFAVGEHAVSKYAPDGTKSTFATGLKYPISVRFDGNGNLFVSDGAANNAETQHSILKFDRDGTKSTFATGISSKGMAFDRSGNLFVSQDDSIFKFTPKGVKSTFVTSKGANFMALAFDEAGNLFVVDRALTKSWRGRSIIKITPDGAKSTFAAGLEDPNDLTADAAGNVYVLGNHAILRLTPDGTKNTFSSAPGAEEAWDLAVDRSGNVFVRNRDAVLKFDPSGTPITFARDLSPDKQWEYRLDHSPQIVKAGTTQVVLDLSEDLNSRGEDEPVGSRVEEARVVWAPDSKRFAFNYSPLHAHHTTYETIALYQLRGDKWVALTSPVDSHSGRTQLAQLAKEHLPKTSPNADVLKVLNWTDATTAILYAKSVWVGRGAEANFLFTLKFDAEGKSKIVKTHRMSEKEVEKGAKEQ